jgi:agmatinase
MINKKVFTGLGAEFTGLERSEIAILPVPYDGTSTWIKGADKGPFAIIEASPALEFYDIDTDYEVYKHGIHTLKALKTARRPEKMAEDVRKAVAGLIKAGKYVVMLGGEHSISAGSIKAFSERYKDLSVLQLDAHSDLRDEYEGSRYNHACVMARAREIAPIVQAGIRSMDPSEKKNMDRSRVFFAKDIVGRKGWIRKAVSKLSKNVYVTIDIDVLDSSVMPSTGTPEPGGLFWYDVVDLLKAVAREKKVVGFDLVELCPSPNNRACDFLAAKLVYVFLTYIFSSGKKR